MVLGLPVEVVEVESCFSNCFGLNQERSLFRRGEDLPFSSDDILGKEEGRIDKKAFSSCSTAKYFYPGFLARKSKMTNLIITTSRVKLKTLANTNCGSTVTIPDFFVVPQGCFPDSRLECVGGHLARDYGIALEPRAIPRD